MTQPLRSALFVPAANERALLKSRSLTMDAVIYDLEDAISPLSKSAAREALINHLQTTAANSFDRSYMQIVRINSLTSEWGDDDLRSLAHLPIDAFLLPKVENTQDIIHATQLLDACKASSHTRLWAMIETARGIQNAAEIARLGTLSSARLSTLVVGPNDIALETGVKAVGQRQFMIPWLMQIILAAKAARLNVLDGVYNDFRDQLGFETECAQAAHMGFDGKTLIHPSQIAPANAAFSPSCQEIERAHAIMALFRQADNHDKGVAALDGEMVERLHIEWAQKILSRAGQAINET